MPVVRALPVLVVPTMAAVAVDVSVDLGVPELHTPVIATMVAVPAPAAPATSNGRAVPESAVAPMAAAEFAVAVAPTAALRAAPSPATPVGTPVALPIALEEPSAPAVPAVGPSLSDAMVRDGKRVFYRLFTCLIVLLSEHRETRSQAQIREKTELTNQDWGFSLFGHWLYLLTY